MSQNSTSNRSRGRNRNFRRDATTFRRRPAPPPPPKTFFQKLIDILTFAWLRKEEPVQVIRRDRDSTAPQVDMPKKSPSRASGEQSQRQSSQQERRPKPEPKRQAPEDVNSERLYVGNLSYDATESDLFELFSSAGPVENAEVVTHSRTQRSKGYAFISMRGVEDAKRAVEILHDKEFMGRKLVVNTARPPSESRGNRQAD